MAVSSEMRAFVYIIGIFFCFLNWGYLQEKVVSSTYVSVDEISTGKWDFPIVMNFSMAFGAGLVASALNLYIKNDKHISPVTFLKPSITCVIGSPCSYAALKYIPFPLMVLIKASKPVPVMMMGFFVFGRRYSWRKVVSVLMLVFGVLMFSNAGDNGPLNGGYHATPMDFLTRAFGICLVFVNLLIDGYTNNTQDNIFKEHGASFLQMMKYVNLWQAFFLMSYLVISNVVVGETSELASAVHLLTHFPQVKYDLLGFCACGCFGQLLVFSLMKEFGSLVWICVSVIRKLLTVLISVIMFSHPVNVYQWLGIAIVFFGIIVEVAPQYSTQCVDTKTAPVPVLEAETAYSKVVTKKYRKQTQNAKKKK